MRKSSHDTAATMQMKKYILPLMTLLVLGQLVFLFTAFDVTGAAADLLGKLLQTR